MSNCNNVCRVLTAFLVGGALLAAGKLFTSTGLDSPLIAATSPAMSSTRIQDGVAKFTDDGELIRPDGYRKWIYVGTPVTPNDMNGGEAPFPEFHSVYIDNESFAHYEKTGEFRDGTVLVKELISVGSKAATSGEGYFMGEFTGLEVTIKDSKRFQDEPGYWAYFSFGHEYPLADTAMAQPSANCNSCHESSAEEDWVFTQYYPVLRGAKQ